MNEHDNQPQGTYNYQSLARPGQSPQGTPPAHSGHPKMHASRIILFLAAIFVVGIVGVVVGGAIMYKITGGATTSTVQKVEASPVTSGVVTDTSGELSVKVAKAVLPSVVSVNVTGAASVNPFTGQESAMASSGSGVIIRDNGYILTNNHVIEGAQKYSVIIGAKSYDAKLVGTDSSTDLAVLKVEETNLPAIKLGDSANLAVGSYVMAVGSPFGLEKSVSTGIISGLGRSNLLEGASSITAYINLIQTDAAINPGNSGGALVDANGRLIGINTLISSTSGSSAGVGFAIPVNSAMDIANQLIGTGKASHPFLGVSTQTIDKASATQYGLPVESGAYVVYTSPNSPADKAGLTRGDIIVKIGSTAVLTTEDVFTAVRSHKAGESVTIEYYRADKKQTLTVVLGSDATQATNSTPSQGNTSQDQGGANQSNPHGNLDIQDLLNLLQQGQGN